MKFITTAMLGVSLIGSTTMSAQGWMISPAPAVPLHPVTLTPPALPPPSPPPPLSPPLSPAMIAPRQQDEIRRLLDPYGLTRWPTSAATVPDPVRALLAFSNFPVTWMLGF